jgi:hypothetical protein
MQVSPAYGYISTWCSGRAIFYTDCRSLGMMGAGRNVMVLLVLYLDIDTSPSTETLNFILEMKLILSLITLADNIKLDNT